MFEKKGLSKTFDSPFYYYEEMLFLFFWFWLARRSFHQNFS